MKPGEVTWTRSGSNSSITSDTAERHASLFLRRETSLFHGRSRRHRPSRMPSMGEMPHER